MQRPGQAFASGSVCPVRRAVEPERKAARRGSAATSEQEWTATANVQASTGVSRRQIVDERRAVTRGMEWIALPGQRWRNEDLEHTRERSSVRRQGWTAWRYSSA